jgi:hypothetical protein
VRSGRIKRKGQHLMLEGVGGGFTWGATLLKFSTMKFALSSGITFAEAM